MARLTALSALPGIALFALMTASAQSQAYPQLRVVALSQHADRAVVAPTDVFHVTIHVRIAQARERLDELILGTFANCEIISNETVRTVVPGGTDFVERLTVQALAPGEATISPAYIDAVDPKIGKPMRFSSNAIRVHVTGPAALDVGLRAVADTARRLLLAAVIAVSCVAALFVLGSIFIRRRKRRPAAELVAPAATVVSVVTPIAPAERLLRAADAYRAARSDATLADVRGVLFEFAGVSRGATLVDALRALGVRALGDHTGPLRAALLAAERALFGPASDRGAAGDEMLAAIQAYREPCSANEDVWTR